MRVEASGHYKPLANNGVTAGGLWSRWSGLGAVLDERARGKRGCLPAPVSEARPAVGLGGSPIYRPDPANSHESYKSDLPIATGGEQVFLTVGFTASRRSWLTQEPKGDRAWLRSHS